MNIFHFFRKPEPEYVAPKPLTRFDVETCVCAAVKATDGSVYRGHRHVHCIKAIRDEGKQPSKRPEDQGFITTKQRYVDRMQGLRLQKMANIKSASGHYEGSLYSEDLYRPHCDASINVDWP